MIHRLRSLQWKNILLIIVVTILSEYFIEFLLFGHVIGRGYTLYSVLLHIVYYLAIPSIIVASELWKWQAKKLVQYLVLVVPTLLHVILHVVPFIHIIHHEDSSTVISGNIVVQTDHNEDAYYEEEDDHHHDLDRYWYIVALILISLQVYTVETLLRRLPLDHRSVECDTDCNH